MNKVKTIVKSGLLASALVMVGMAAVAPAEKAEAWPWLRPSCYETGTACDTVINGTLYHQKVVWML